MSIKLIREHSLCLIQNLPSTPGSRNYLHSNCYYKLMQLSGREIQKRKNLTGSSAILKQNIIDCGEGNEQLSFNPLRQAGSLDSVCLAPFQMSALMKFNRSAALIQTGLSKWARTVWMFWENLSKTKSSKNDHIRPKHLKTGKWTLQKFMSISPASVCLYINLLPVMVPWTWVPFFSSMVTVSWLSFIKNLKRQRWTRLCSVTWG